MIRARIKAIKGRGEVKGRGSEKRKGKKGMFRRKIS